MRPMGRRGRRSAVPRRGQAWDAARGCSGRRGRRSQWVRPRPSRVGVREPQREAPLEGGQPASGRRGVPPSQLARRPPDEHVVRGGVDHPVVSLAGVVVVSRHLDEALVEAEVVPDRVLPALLVGAVVRKVLEDELVDAVERETLLRALADGHHDEGVVGEGRLLVLLPLLQLGPLLRRQLGLLLLLTPGA